MEFHSIKWLPVFFSFVLVSCQSGSVKKNVPLKTDVQKSSYAIGQQIGQSLKAQGVDLDVDVFSMSISDALEGRESRLSDQEIQKAMHAMRQNMAMKRREGAKKSKEKGEKFLEANKKKKGVKVTKSGLQYQVLKEGKGKSPKASDRVKVHYRGTLIDGKEFDSSYKRNQPAEFALNRVIKGWTEGLQLMKEGAKWKFFIPSELGYGGRAQASIPANSVLIFDVELLEVKKG